MGYMVYFLYPGPTLSSHFWGGFNAGRVFYVVCIILFRDLIYIIASSREMGGAQDVSLVMTSGHIKK